MSPNTRSPCPRSIHLPNLQICSAWVLTQGGASSCAWLFFSHSFGSGWVVFQKHRRMYSRQSKYRVAHRPPLPHQADVGVGRLTTPLWLCPTRLLSTHLHLHSKRVFNPQTMSRIVFFLQTSDARPAAGAPTKEVQRVLRFAGFGHVLL